MSEKKPLPFSPEKLVKLKLSPPKKISAGAEALKSAIQHAVREMGVWSPLSTLSRVNQKGGVDCPGCAWPDPDEKRSSLGEYCENGVKAIAEEATTQRVDPAFFSRFSIQDLSEKTDYWLGKAGRITQPMYLPKGGTHYQPLSWEEAFTKIGAQLRNLSDPNQAAFYTSGRTSNEAAFLLQLFARLYGTNNLPDCSNMCHESSGVALSETLGIGKGSVKLEDFEQAEVILISGQNPGTNHPRMLSALKKAKKKGAKIIAINPLKEAGLLNFRDPQNPADLLGKTTQLADIYLQVTINGDVALTKALLYLLLQAEQNSDKEVFDKAFIEAHTEGYAELIQHIETIDFAAMVDASGVPESEIRKAVDLLTSSKRIIWCWAMGITQHENGIHNIREIVNVLLAKGAIGKPGAGTCPVRGHSNVQGDRTMGIFHKPSDTFLNRIADTYGFTPPTAHGYDVVECIEAMHAGKVTFFMAMGGNFLPASPDTELTAEALQNCEMTVHVSTKLNRSHVVPGKESLILPCLGRTELDQQASGRQYVTMENSMGVVHSSTGKKKPASPHLKSEPAIICGIAKETFGTESVIDWEAFEADYDVIREGIAQVIPGCENYSQRASRPGGFYLPNGARVGKFHTDSSKAKFTINKLPQHSLETGEYLMMTIRSHDQFNTTIYGMDDRYRGIHNERRVIFMNEQDMTSEGLSSQQVVDLFSEYDEKTRWALSTFLEPKCGRIPHDDHCTEAMTNSTCTLNLWHDDLYNVRKL